MTGRSAGIPLAAALACAPVVATAQVLDGLTIFNRIGSRTTSLVDNTGRTVNSWSSNNNGYISYLLPDSTAWRMEVYSGSVMRGGPYGGLMQHYDWRGSVFESFLWSDSNHQQHHDINVMPNGHVLVVAWARKTMAEAIALGRLNISSDIWPDEVIEWDPAADSAVWEWSFWDHLIQDVDPGKPNYGVVAEHPERLDINLGMIRQGGDWMHINSVDYNEERDEVIITSHELDEVYVIDHSTTTAEARGSTGGRHGRGGDLLYRWGNPQNYDRGGASDQVLFVAHGANWIRPGMPGAASILMLNNGDRPGTSGDSSSVLEITPPLDSADHYHIHPDSAFGPRQVAWQYSNGRGFYS
ncbi:arylsulfotransferase (ASST), partial [candidate division WOR-3 bacterium]|nr:arylsulfotransferase (ASST) [candidate division WOR-3 bacterium]